MKWRITAPMCPGPLTSSASFLAAASLICVMALTSSAQTNAFPPAIYQWLTLQYTNPVVLRKEHGTLVVKHVGGVTIVPLSAIPTLLQQASEDIIFTPLGQPLTIAFTNASPSLRQTLTKEASATWSVIGGTVTRRSLFTPYDNRVTAVLGPNLYLLDNGIAIQHDAIHVEGDAMSGLARPDGVFTQMMESVHFNIPLFPFREYVSRSDADGNCYLSSMNIYLVRPPPYNVEVLDGVEITGYATNAGIHRYESAPGTTRRIRKWVMLTPDEVARATVRTPQEVAYRRLINVQADALTEQDVVGYLSTHGRMEFQASLKHPCKTCAGKGRVISTTEFESVPALCSRCGGKGRVAQTGSAPPADRDIDLFGIFTPEKKTVRLGTIQGANEVTYRDCSRCDGTGRVPGRRPREVPCVDCRGSGCLSLRRTVTCTW